ncbi:MAG: hypothetical protein ACRD4I_01515, partial [Candidatus Angelobacter sp.]
MNQSSVENYFNYFTEIEEQYQKRRGAGLILSTLDWALIETWKDAGIPLEAVLRGVHETFDKYDRRPVKPKKINSLAYCAQEVLSAAEEMKEAAVGAAREQPKAAAGLSAEEIAGFFKQNAEKLRQVALPLQVAQVASDCAATLENLAAEMNEAAAPGPLED